MIQHPSFSNLSLNNLDPDRFLLSLFIRQSPERAAIVAVDLLNYEVSRVRDVVDTPHMGLIRLQWWRDEIRKIYAGTSSLPHPVLAGINDLVVRYDIPYDDFDRAITAREADFEEYDTFDMTAYARAIHQPIMHIKARILGESADIGPLAEGYAITGLIRAIPFYRARAQVMIPSIHPDAVKALCDRAGVLLDRDPAQHRYFRAHHALARLYLNQLAATGYHPEKLFPLPFKEIRLWWRVTKLFIAEE